MSAASLSCSVKRERFAGRFDATSADQAADQHVLGSELRCVHRHPRTQKQRMPRSRGRPIEKQYSRRAAATGPKHFTGLTPPSPPLRHHCSDLTRAPKRRTRRHTQPLESRGWLRSHCGCMSDRASSFPPPLRFHLPATPPGPSNFASPTLQQATSCPFCAQHAHCGTRSSYAICNLRRARAEPGCGPATMIL